MIPDQSPAPSNAPHARVLPDALSDFSLRQLLSFRAVAQESSFHGAADALDYTQSAVSQHVAALEAALGVRLFDRGRGRRTVALTEAGQLLLRHVEPIADRLQAARADLAAYAAGETGTLRVAVYQSVGAKALPAIIGRFGRDWPGIGVHLTEVLSDDAGLAMIADGEVELAFGILPLPQGPYEGVELLRDPFVVVARPDAPLVLLGDHPTIEQIAGQKLIGFRTCRSTKYAEERLRETGLQPEFVFRSEDNGIIQAMAAAGLGVAVVPLLTVDQGDPSIRILPTELEPRRVALVWHRDRYRSPATRAFIDIARQVCADLAADLGIAAAEA
jgi:DNA-binding transcriptional LysR family regulator